MFAYMCCVLSNDFKFDKSSGKFSWVIKCTWYQFWAYISASVHENWKILLVQLFLKGFSFEVDESWYFHRMFSRICKEWERPLLLPLMKMSFWVWIFEVFKAFLLPSAKNIIFTKCTGVNKPVTSFSSLRLF